jgi:nucleoside-diphosphate-sugar epimerase
MVEDIAGVKLRRKYDLNAPTGVNGRNSDNTLIKKLLNWEPSIPLRTGMEKTYAWIYDQYVKHEKKKAGIGLSVPSASLEPSSVRNPR